MERQFELQTPEQWKAFSHPLRLRILGLLASQALTNEELAAAIGEQSGKLYFHTKKLLDAGLIALDSTRQKGPITEKLYRAVAHRFTAPTPVKGGKAPPLERLIATGLDLYRTTWSQTNGLADQTELGFHMVLPLDLKRQTEFITRIQALFHDFRASDSEEPDAHKIALTVLMHSVDTQKEKKNARAIDSSGSADGSADDGSGETDTRGRRG